jgi:release factor glutamine methyltransferase
VSNGVHIHLVEADILKLEVGGQGSEDFQSSVFSLQSSDIRFQVIVSNPPYVTRSESEEMKENVLQYEPHLALFVNDDNALIFYDKIADFAWTHLNKGGYLFFEINEAKGEEVVKLLQDKGFSDIELRKDLRGRDRMVKALKQQ